MDAAASGQSPPAKQEPVDADLESEHRKPISPEARRQSGRAQQLPVKAAAAQAPTKERRLDHIGFTVKDLKALIIDESGVGIAFITNIEINERPIR